MKMVYVNWEKRMALNAEGFMRVEEILKAEIKARLTDNPDYSFENWINERYTAHDVITSSEAWQMSLAHEYVLWFNKQVQELLEETLENDWERVCAE